jgi:4-amino-4-deoxy-L-arabinose transferase-like glycosyltransferase
MCLSRLSETVVVNRWLTLTLVVALAVRLGLAFVVQQRVDQPPAQLCLIPGDAEGYWELARTIATGTPYRIYEPPRYVLRVPGFPTLLALSQLLFGPGAFPARCLLACVGTAACGLTYWLGRELVDGTTGLIAAVYTALSPTLALFSVLILSETTFAAVLLASLIAIVRLARCSQTRFTPFRGFAAGLTAGLFIGLATLVRPTWLYVGPAIAVAALIAGSPRGQWRSWVPRLAGLACGIVLLLGPWTARNYYVTGHVVPTTLWVGPSLYDGLNPAATGDSDMTFIETDQLQKQLSEYEVDREYSRRAWEFVAANPLRTVWLAMKKQQRYWSLVPNASQFQNPWLKIVVCLTSLPLLVFSGIGLWFCRRDLGLVAVAVGPVLLFAALHLLFVGSLRYRLPAEYPLAVIGAVGLGKLMRQASWGMKNAE